MIKYRIKRLSFLKSSILVSLVLTCVSWISILTSNSGSLSLFFSTRNYDFTKRFLGRLFDFSSPNSALRDIESWKRAYSLTVETLQMSILATTFTVIAVLLVVVYSSRNVANGRLTLVKRWYFKPLFIVVRIMYILSRAIPELLWAMIVIFILKPGILAGAVALFLHNFGILGKLCSEVIEDLEMNPIRNLASSGARGNQLLIYGVIPSVIPKFMTYILYRWEVIIRTTVVVGLVGAGGLGQQFKLSMSWFKYTEVTQLIISYLILVGVVDLISTSLRKVIKNL